jgi:hypothetical protein
VHGKVMCDNAVSDKVAPERARVCVCVRLFVCLFVCKCKCQRKSKCRCKCNNAVGERVVCLRVRSYK